MNKKDYYEVLGIEKSASDGEIRKAYRKLAKEYHPDRNKAEDAEAKFKEAKEAYDILSDKQKRSAYDQYGHAGTQGFNGGGGGYGGFGGFENMGDLNDIFEQFFSGGFNGFGGSGRPGRARSSATRGADLEVTIKLSFMDAVFGIEKTIKYKRMNTCKKCNGSGAKDSSSKETCKTCNGQGQVIRVQQAFMLGQIRTQVPCPDCDATGEIIKNKCKECKGETRTETHEKFTLKIPPGIPDGVTLRFQNRGNAGKKGGNFGDLFVNIEVEVDERFERRGNDIYTQIEIDAITATLGDIITIPTVHGDVDLKISAGTQPEKIIKLSGKGGPKFRDNGNGDQYILIKVVIPEKLSKKQRKSWEKLQAIVEK